MACTCDQTCSNCGPATNNTCNCAKGECKCASCVNKAHNAQCACKSGAECACAKAGKACNC
ncbi:hypothetical protein EWM64_g2289 [Hericium alpestre]|uniref:Metallothionein n=1 Tax=Hericium alpestre TaxID=135208 RepID=A0A4Z0A5U8_9AGAM|nr:hypothetical protein EWM64_g2289 [Hericium alpestre]